MVTYDLKRFSLSDGFWTWGEWLTEWEKTEDVHRAMGLLHVIFQATCENKVQTEERIIFLLRLADGWPHWSVSGGNTFNRSGQRLSMRAFRLLGNGFFNLKSYRTGTLWNHFKYQGEDLREQLLIFFRPHNDLSNLSNLSSSQMFGDEYEQAQKFAREYMIEFTEHLLSNSEYRSKVIEIWAAIKELDRLYHYPGPKIADWREKFDEPTLEKLEELMLRRYPTFKEALLMGNQAAYALAIAKAAGIKMPKKEIET